MLRRLARAALVLIQLVCGWCRARFFVCRPCYHGQGYCGDLCREKSRKEILAKAEQTYRKKPEVRASRAERARFRRARRREEAARVAHLGSTLATGAADLPTPTGPVSPIPGEPATGGGSESNGAVHDDHQARQQPDAAAAETGQRRADAGLAALSGAVLLGEAGQGAIGRPVALARCPLARCAVCGRTSDWILPGSHRRARDRVSHAVLRDRHGQAGAPPPGPAARCRRLR